jgi:hypothetical protein
MGWSARRRDAESVSIIPRDIQDLFDEVDIERTWDYLEKTFKLNKKLWKAKFEDEYKVSSREFSKVELFVRFGKEHFEFSICQLIFRNPVYDHTWLKICRYIVKDKIEERKKEEESVRKEYGRSSSYKRTNRQY